MDSYLYIYWNEFEKVWTTFTQQFDSGILCCKIPLEPHETQCRIILQKMVKLLISVKFEDVPIRITDSWIQKNDRYLEWVIIHLTPQFLETYFS